MAQEPTPIPPQTPAKFNPDAPHQQRPKLRQIRGFPAMAGDQQVIGLSDARQVSDKVVFAAPAIQFVLPLMDGNRGLDEIVSSVGRGLNRAMLEQLVAQLDDAGLLFGPTFDAMLSKMRADFDSTTILPPAATAAIADALAVQELGEKASDEQKQEVGPTKLREALDSWMATALQSVQNPSFDALPKAIIAPHIDYMRGWMNYGAAWGRMRVVDRPARVVILGTNHFGESTGVCACDKGFQSPFGVCEPDAEFVAALKSHLGPENTERAFANRYDHEREHSIELQIPWIQHCLGTDESGNYCKVFGALVHDPAVNNGESYDGKGLGLAPFVESMRKTIASLPGPTLLIASADLSHVGPMFGDQQPLAGEGQEVEERRNRVFKQDRELLQMIAEQKIDELIAAMAWQQNPTRWCSAGNIVATLQIAQPKSVQLLNYAAAMDQNGLGMVSHAAAVMN